MNAKTRYFRLGAFVLGALVVGLGFLLAFGAGQWWRPKTIMETYFNESVQGIDLGTPVKYRGVTVGEVRLIGFAYTRYEQDKPPAQRKQYVMVEAVLRPQEVTGQRRGLDQSTVQTLIEQGLRVQMAAQGLTGTYYLELDYVDPKLNPPLPIDWQPENLYVPSATSAVGKIVSGAESLMRKLDQANLDEVVVNVNALLVGINQSLQALQTERVGTGAVQLLAEVRDSNRKLQAILGNPAWQSLPKEATAAMTSARRLLESEQFPATIARLRQTLESLDRAAARLDRALAGPERDLPLILDNLRQTSQNLRDLTESLRRSPASAIFSEPPRPLPRPAPARK